jgi:glycosyltransferase involved in cell wall biosynthesis
VVRSPLGRRPRELVVLHRFVKPELIVSELVSILIPCYNAERWIGHAIESALAQTWSAKEIIVLDDGSTDQSLEVIQKYGAHVRYETSAKQGANPSRNRLLDLARGQWLQYLDADDYLLPEKIAGQMDFLATHPEADVIFGPVTYEYWSPYRVERQLYPIPEPHDPWVLLASWRLPQTGAALWRKQAIIDVGGWKHDQPCCQEHELYLRLIIHGKRFAYFCANGAVYRQWSSETTCHSNIAEVHRRRLEIEQAAEDYLRLTQQLTSMRLRAISQARFETARSAWQYDSAFAYRILEKLHEVDPNFQPVGPAARLAYRLAFQWLGFKKTETLAAKKRRAAQCFARLLRIQKQWDL